MAVFQSYDELRTIFGRLYDEAKSDSRIALPIRDAHIVVRFRYDDPQAVVTINATQPSSQKGAFFDVFWGDTNELKPNIEMSMKADVAHQFWQGKIHLMTAITRRQIIAKGPIPKILKLLPTVEPMYEMYPRILLDMGRSDLILS